MVSRVFRVVGVLLGVPSLLAAIALGVGGGLLGHVATQRPTPYLDIGTYGLVGLLANGAHAVGGVLGFLNGLASWVMLATAALALVAALLGLLLYLIGRGIWWGAMWARIVGALVIAQAILVALGALSALSAAGKVVDGATLAALAYGLWVLGWRYGEHRSAN